MTHIRTLILLLAAALLAVPAAAQPSERAVSRYSRLDDSVCTADRRSRDRDQEGMFVARRCPGMGEQRVWLLYGEGIYLRVGFGRIGNLNGLFDAERARGWPVEWRGTERGGRFRPHAAILRLRRPHQTRGPGELVVFRLGADGRSCIIGSVPAGAGQNERAREIADRMLGGPVPCRERSDPF
jgi:hypothetical protein